MKSMRTRFIAVSLILVMLFSMTTFDANNASAASSTIDLSAQPMSAVQSALNNATSGDTITVIGATTVSTGYVFTIRAGVTVDWQARVSGVVSPATAFMITLNGSGTFNICSGGSINNTGTGGTINLAGDGATLNVQSGGEILAERSGSAVNISVSNTTLNITPNGSVTNTGTTSAVNVMTQLMNVRINVNGGSIISVPTGNAINDSGGDTHITVADGGTVMSGAARAIWSQGMDSMSTVLVDGGIVANAAGNNLNPAIDMSGVQGNLLGGGWNVVVQGSGVVRSTSSAGFALQTRGNVLVTDNAQVISINGRGINLVGVSSYATVSGGAVVSAVGTGTAISTATTNPQDLPNTGIIVEGGTVSSVGGNAINITGVNSTVVVKGGTVSSVSGNAINADTGLISTNLASNQYANFSIIVAGGLVSSNTGYAIQNLGGGPNSKVIVSDTASGTGGYGGPGGQVAVFRTGAAIRAPGGTVTVNGGFVFAYGTSTATAISAQAIRWPMRGQGGGGQVAVWNHVAAAGRSHYEQGSALDLTISAGSFPLYLQWYYNPRLGSGLYYYNAPTAGFFPISDATVSNDYALIFDSYNGVMYRDYNKDGVPVKGYEATVGKAPLDADKETGAWWATQRDDGGYDLHLSGFSWTTFGVNRALTIMKSAGTHDGVTIFLNGNSIFDSRPTGGVGITVGNNLTINIDGSGTLTARGGQNEGVGLSLYDPNTVTSALGEMGSTLGEAVSTLDEMVVDCEELNNDNEHDEFDEVDESTVPPEILDEEIGLDIDDFEHDALEGEGAVASDDELNDEIIVPEAISGEVTALASSGSVSNITIAHGEFIAQGGLSAVSWPGASDGSMQQWPTNTVDVPEITLYYRWKWSSFFDGSEVGAPGPSSENHMWDQGTNIDADFTFFHTDKYVRLTALQTVSLMSATQMGGVSNLADSIAIELLFDVGISDLDIDDVIIRNASGAVIRGTTLTGSGDTWIVWLDSVQAQGIVEVVVAEQIVGFFVENNAILTDVYKEMSFSLNVLSGAGGTVAGTPSGVYPLFYEVSVTAVADEGYRFAGWTFECEGVEIEGGLLEMTAEFDMPGKTVIIIANFVLRESESNNDNENGNGNGNGNGNENGSGNENGNGSENGNNNGTGDNNGNNSGSSGNNDNGSNGNGGDKDNDNNNGNDNAELQVKKLPQTGVNQHLLVPIVVIIMLAVLVALFGAELYRRQRKSRR